MSNIVINKFKTCIFKLKSIISSLSIVLKFVALKSYEIFILNQKVRGQGLQSKESSVKL